MSGRNILTTALASCNLCDDSAVSFNAFSPWLRTNVNYSQHRPGAMGISYTDILHGEGNNSHYIFVTN